MDGGGWAIGMGLMVLLIVLAVVVVVGGSARELLNRRLVSGEITEDDYRRLRAALSDTPAPSPHADQPAP